jgi:EAL domain-containing protein (putative c-di-GMP-specific phosphodiesterase class I)
MQLAARLLAGLVLLPAMAEAAPALTSAQAMAQLAREGSLSGVEVAGDLDLSAVRPAAELSELVMVVTEGRVVERSDEVAAKLRMLRRAGVQVAIDDFGTGYSSLSYPSRRDIDLRRIDPAFTRAIGADHRDIALCEAIVVIASVKALFRAHPRFVVAADVAVAQHGGPTALLSST